MSLISDIQTHILKPEYPTSSILREAMVLARKLRSDELMAWAKAELEGYRTTTDLPAYRRFPAVSKGTGSNPYFRATSYVLPTSVLPDDIRPEIKEGRMSGGVGELEGMLESGAEEFAINWPDHAIYYFNRSTRTNFDLLEAHQVVTRSFIKHILDTVRTRLLDFILEIEELHPDAGTVPSLEAIPPTRTQYLVEKLIMKNEENHGDVLNIGTMQGSIIATGQARVSSSQASYTSTADPAAALNELKSHIDEVAAAQREEVVRAIDLLIAAIEDRSIPKSRMVAAVETVGNASPRLMQALRDLAIGTTSSLYATGIWECIQLVVG